MATTRSRRRRFAASLLLTALAIAIPATPALAGKPSASGSTTSSSVALAMVDGSDNVANHGERAAFVVKTSATDRPFVGVRCYQAGTFVLDGYTGYFSTYLYDPWVTLDSPYWASGTAADCTARLFYYDKRGNQKVVATLSFVAQP